MKLAVAGTGYVGLSLVVLLSQRHQVAAVGILPQKVELINQKNRPSRTNTLKNILPKKS